jgi:hypothetical protein
VKHEPDAAERQIDRQPPAQVAGTVAPVLRGRRTGSSCDDTGSIVIEITGANDDRTPSERIGYASPMWPAHSPMGSTGRATRVSCLRACQWLAMRPGRCSFSRWRGGIAQPTTRRASISPSRSTAVDLAGNESMPSLPVRVRHPGGKPDP